ncbi:MAG: hypothetical protein QM730_25390 [Anaerolineales bacterium]
METDFGLGGRNVPLTAYSAITGGAAKTNSEGGESLYTKAGG